MKSITASFLAGGLFAAGLALAGMTSPERVLAFLDVSGSWDPSLAFVMVGAIGVYLPLQWLVRRRRAPVLATRFAVPAETPVDTRLLVGAATFGIGWGLVGYCPAPAIASLATGSWPALVFVGGMLGGLAVYEAARHALGARDAEAPAPPVASPARTKAR